MPVDGPKLRQPLGTAIEVDDVNVHFISACASSPLAHSNRYLAGIDASCSLNISSTRFGLRSNIRS
jgi:hypothetical protein